MGETREILCGIHAVSEMLCAGRRRCSELWVARERSPEIAAVLALAARVPLPVHQVPRHELDRRCRDPHHQGIAAAVDGYPYTTLEAMLEGATRDPKGPCVVILDQVQDPHNLGAIARTTLGCGMHGLILTRHASVGVTPAVVRAAAGATEWLAIAQVTNLHNTIKTLKSQHIWVVGFDAMGSHSLYQYQFTGGHAIVMGAEGEGLRRLVKESCDTLLTIPVTGPVGSYNVSVACAMALSEVVRQRN